jgi:energy-converting hydrogenase Eha subunit C
MYYFISLFNNFLWSAVPNDKANFSDEVRRTWAPTSRRMFLLSSGPSQPYGQALGQVLNTEQPKSLTDCYTAGLNDAINILLVKMGLVHLSSQCIGLDVLKPNICYSPALTILSCLSYSVTNRPAWKLNNKLIREGLNKQIILNLFDHMGVLCSAKRK